MKILLVGINAKYIHTALAIHSLRAASRYKKQIQLAEFTINQQPDEIIRQIYQERPDYIGFSCYLWNITYVKMIVPEIHKLLPKAKIYLGGPEALSRSDSIKESLPMIKDVLTCEEELPFEELPFPYEDFDWERNEHRILYYESSRGCPFSCSYCLSCIDKKLRFRPMELVKKELAIFIEKNVKQVKFVDRTFNCDHVRATEIWKYILEHDNGITNFHFEIAADLLTDQELIVISQMRPGLIQLEIGVQTTNDRTLAAIHRTMDLERVRENVACVKKYHNTHQHLDLIAGLPYEDYESFRRSFNEVYAMQPEQLQLGFLKVLAGTPMYEHAGEYGCVCHDMPPYEVLYTDWLSYEDLLQLKQVEEMVEIYYNSAQFTQSIPYLTDLWETPFDFYHDLASYYESHGYELISHSRLRRYEILRSFAASRADRDVLDRLLTLDLYLRERLKKRPEWAVDFEDKVLFDYNNRDPLTNNAYIIENMDT